MVPPSGDAAGAASMLRRLSNDPKIMAEAARVIRECRGCPVSLEGEQLLIAPDDPLSVLSMTLVVRSDCWAWQDEVKVLVAMGGLVGVRCGIPVPGNCLLHMMMTTDLRCYTYDFYVRYPTRDSR